jgi:hypothetical protein
MRVKNWMFLTIFFLLLSSCNLMAAKETPVAGVPEAPGVDVMGTAVELTTVAKPTEVAGKAVATARDIPTSVPTETPTPNVTTPSPTPCTPLVTANTATSIHSGPDTASAVVGALPVGGTARLAGRNNANTWWYIEFSGGAGGHAWVSNIAVTTSCLPSVVQIVAASAPPQPRTSLGSAITIADVNLPDLVASGMKWSPNPKKDQILTITVKVTNKGRAATDTSFIVDWFADRNQDEPACTWDVEKLDINESVFLDCRYTYNSEEYSDTNSFWVTEKVDTANEITESNESKDSNTRYALLQLGD